MKPQKLRTRLQRLSRKELEELSHRVCGDPNSSLKNKEALVDVLLRRRRHVAEALGLQMSWMERNNVHVYGAIGVLGVALTAATFLYPNDSHTVVDNLREQEVLAWVEKIRSSDPEVLRDATATRVHVEAVPEPTTAGFELINHRVATDLRSFKYLSSVDQRDKKSAVVQQIDQMLLNTSGSDAYRLTAVTSGIDVYSQSNTHDGRLTVYASNERRLVANYRVVPRIIEIDVSESPKDFEFPLHVSKTYWSAFQNPDQSWVGTRVALPTLNIEFLVIFPENRPFTDFDLFVDDANGNRLDLPNESYVLTDPQGLWLWWNIVNPQVGHGYNIDWEWTDP